MLSVGETIAVHRIANGFTQEQLSFELGDVSASSIGQWELGKTSPTLDHFLDLMEVLSIPCADFFADDGDGGLHEEFDLAGRAVPMGRNEWEAYRFALQVNPYLDAGRFVEMIRS